MFVHRPGGSARVWLVASPRARDALGLMFDPVFGALLWGKMFAVVAVWTHGIVAAIVMYDATPAGKTKPN